uniref:Macro domain-containing protein n=1 Tax=Astyanax mexicanus TaxID=7994 RepID=A0A3B1IL13_ASTMX
HHARHLEEGSLRSIVWKGYKSHFQSFGNLSKPTSVSHCPQMTQTPVKQHHAPKIRYTKQLSGGMKISVWKDDLTTHKVDAVVNTANEQLQHGGLALALSRAGGPEIQQMSDHYIQTNRRVHTGDAIVTTAGKLPCKMIIHAVGPPVPKNPSAKDVSAAKPFLESVIWKILTLAQYNNLQSVAIPAISSGLYNFPRHICADIIVNTVKSFSDKQHPQSTSLEVRLVNNDDPSVREMLRACQQLLGPSGTMQKQTIVSTKSA